MQLADDGPPYFGAALYGVFSGTEPSIEKADMSEITPTLSK
jgi:hypothetical protein